MAGGTAAELAEQVHRADGEGKCRLAERRSRDAGLQPGPEEEALAGDEQSQKDAGGCAQTDKPKMGEGPGPGAPVRRQRAQRGGGEGTQRRRVHRAAHQGPAEALGEGGQHRGEQCEADGKAGRLGRVTHRGGACKAGTGHPERFSARRASGNRDPRVANVDGGAATDAHCFLLLWTASPSAVRLTGAGGRPAIVGASLHRRAGACGEESSGME